MFSVASIDPLPKHHRGRLMYSPDRHRNPFLEKARSPAQLRSIVHYNYVIPGTRSVVGIDFDTDDRLEFGAVHMLLSQSIQDVTMKLHFGGDRPVPGQNYWRDVVGPQGHHLHISIWSIDEERKPDELTYKFVEETLRGLWEYMVKRRVALQSEAHLYHDRLGMVALAFVQDVDSPEKVLDRPVTTAR